MLTLLTVCDGTTIEAVIVHRTRSRMRAIAPGLSDALDLRRNGRGWSLDSGEPVQFEFFATVSSSSVSDGKPALLTHTAGHA